MNEAQTLLNEYRDSTCLKCGQTLAECRCGWRTTPHHDFCRLLTALAEKDKP